MPGQKVIAPSAPERASRARQRQRLIDACISALYIHGPSRTTVEKVVAIADLSPGIVRFYFESKDAMLVASLAYLAAEFEERVMLPVASLRETPVRALELLVDLYLDPDIASPRKVSVWYSFWGEASSRKEYYQICGKKDDEFAALVLDLTERLIARSGEAHLDPDGVALGLIGVLEVIWQGLAFTEEADIDRAAGRRRAMGYLRSVFPQHFAGAAAPVLPSAIAVPAWAYADAALLALERERLLRPSWQLAAHEAQIPAAGDFLTLEVGTERVLLVRDQQLRIRAFRNTCRKRPHALLSERRGHLQQIECAIHGYSYGLDGRANSGTAGGDLIALELVARDRLLLVRSLPNPGAPSVPPQDWQGLPDLIPVLTQDLAIRADWKLVVEQWLEALPRPQGVRRVFVAPNQLLETGPQTLSVLQVIPDAPGRCHLRRLEFGPGVGVTASAVAAPHDAGGAALPTWLRQDIEVAESTQVGMTAGAAEADEAAPATGELAQFRHAIGALLAMLPVQRT